MLELVRTLMRWLKWTRGPFAIAISQGLVRRRFNQFLGVEVNVGVIGIVRTRMSRSPRADGVPRRVTALLRHGALLLLTTCKRDASPILA
jgi:hypothetical protein